MQNNGSSQQSLSTIVSQKDFEKIDGACKLARETSKSLLRSLRNQKDARDAEESIILTDTAGGLPFRERHWLQLKDDIQRTAKALALIEEERQRLIKLLPQQTTNRGSSKLSSKLSSAPAPKACRALKFD